MHGTTNHKLPYLLIFLQVLTVKNTSYFHISPIVSSPPLLSLFYNTPLVKTISE